MTRKFLSVVLIIAFIALVAGCETIPEEHRGAAIGAGVGAAAGTAAGAIISKGAGGAVVGALVGALLGGVIGHYAFDKTKSREKTVDDYSYEETQGTVVSIEEALASPSTIAPGETIELQATYVLLNPIPDSLTRITEIREITLNGEPVGQPEVTVERTGGTYVSSIPIRLPSNAKKGVYKVRTTVQTATAKDTKETTFTVL